MRTPKTGIPENTMNKTTNTKVKKILLLASLLVMMLALCGCRTRITNNDEVSNVMYDEEGTRIEEYDMRREELGLGTAKKPVFTGMGGVDNNEDDEYDEADWESLEDYQPDEESEYEEGEIEEAAPAEGTGEGGTGTSLATGKALKKGDKGKKGDALTIALDPNGGECEAEAIEVKIGDDYGKLPTATRKGYTFKGWYTEKKGGDKIKKDTKVAEVVIDKLYAHWEKKDNDDEEEAKKNNNNSNNNSNTEKQENTEKKEEPATQEVLYTVIYTDGDGKTLLEVRNLKAGDATPKMKADPEPREGDVFTGWDKKIADTIDASQADSNHVITYTAQWNPGPYKKWSADVEATTESLDKLHITAIDDSEDLAAECNGKKGDATEYIGVVFVDKLDDTDSAVDKLDKDVDYERVVAVSKAAVKEAKKDKNKKLYLQLLMMYYIHEGRIPEDAIDQAKKDLEIDSDNDDLVKTVKVPEKPEPEDPTPSEPEDPTPGEGGEGGEGGGEGGA